MSNESRVVERDIVDLGEIQDKLDKLDKIEKRLNEKLYIKEFREGLLKDPIDVLKKEGIILPKDKEKSTIDFFKSVSVPPEAVIGANVSRAPGIGIGITVRF
jgi:hypothetical protein